MENYFAHCCLPSNQLADFEKRKFFDTPSDDASAKPTKCTKNSCGAYSHRLLQLMTNQGTFGSVCLGPIVGEIGFHALIVRRWVALAKGVSSVAPPRYAS